MSGDVYACQDAVEEKTDLVIRISPVSEPLENHEDISQRMVLLQKFRHSQIENVLDFGRLAETGELFLISTLVEGSDFYTGTENLNLSITLTLFVEILRILRYPHTRGVIHGNLTSESVILIKNSEGRMVPFLRDFTLSCRAGRNCSSYNRESICHAAPELLLEGHKDKKTDFYALGILLYQSLTRRLPFENGDPDFVIQKQIQGNINLDPVERLDGGKSIIPLLKRLLEKDPQKRIQSVYEALAFIPSQIRRGFILPEEKGRHFSAAPFIEREKEMRLLRDRAGRVKEYGRGWTVFITGEAGSGKTRCMEELRGWALVNGWRVEAGSCSSNEDAPYSLFRRILGKTDFYEEKTVAFSEDVSLVAEPYSCATGLSAGRLQDRMTRELVRRLSGRPTLLLLHDIHWASKETCAVLEYLCSDIRAHPIFVCACFRADEILENAIHRVIDSARREERGEVVPLDPLTKNGVRQMVAGLTNISKRREYLYDWMYRAIGGNPLFLEEMLEHLAENRILRNQLGSWKFTAHPSTKPMIPSRIGAILRNRMARLSLPAMETLEWLSLFQRATPRKYTELLTASDAGTNDVSFAELNRCRLLRMESLEGEQEAAPGYELIAEVAKEMIPQERKRKMYREIAELLEKEAGKDHLYEAALHYTESPPDERSVYCALTAIAGFQAIFDHENALRCFEYAFRYKNRLTEKEVFQAMIAACDSMFALGKARRAAMLIQSALRSREGVDPELKTRLYLCLAKAFRHIGDWRGQERSCYAGLRMLRRFPVPGRVVETLLWTELAFSAIMRSRTRNALSCLDRAIEVCPDKNSPALFGNIQNLYAILYYATCEFEKSAAAGEKAIAVLGHSDEHLQKCSALSALGLAYMKRGRFAAALRLHLRAAAMGEKNRSVVQRSLADRNLAECLCRIGYVQKSFEAMYYAATAARESNNPTIRRLCDAVAAEINLSACNYKETRRILKTLDGDEKQTLSVFTAARVNYVSAELNFNLGDFTNALNDIRKLREKRTEETPLYEYELAEALGERILFERDENPGTLARLRILESRVRRKRWPYQRCLIKLHICEILIRLKRWKTAESYARNTLRLAKGMWSVSLQCRAHLMMGIIFSPLQRTLSAEAPAFADIRDADKSIRSLNECLNQTDASSSLECRFRALTELSFIYRFYEQYELCFSCARQAYEALVKLEKRTPPDMLNSFRGVFGRDRIKQELERLIEDERRFCQDTRSVKCSKNANAGILLRMTKMVNSVREITPLLDGLLDLALPAIAVRRGLIFLLDEAAGKLEQAGRRCVEKGSGVFTDNVSHAVLESVFREGKPLVSADAGCDPRIMGKCVSEPPGKLLCIPLKTPERKIGVFYADCFKPAELISEAEIDLAEAFCSLTALAVDNILTHRKLVTQASVKSGFTKTPDPFPEIIGASTAIRLLKERISLVAASPLDVLITGESGSGKELVARAISGSDRKRNGKFISVDCGTLSDGVAEAELFGFRKGTFTGAVEDRIGLLEAASGGILFLDEISNMPLRIQVKLLRTLQEREIRRIGETFPRKIQLRVVAATNKDLTEEIKNERFCGDLFFRLKNVEIHTPSLRERVEDIPLLIESFLQKIFEQEKGEIRLFSPEAMGLLQQYSYPGNIRELKNIVAVAYYSSSGRVIEAGMLPPEIHTFNVAYTTPNSTADNLYREILAGDGGFEDLVKKPYLTRRFEASVVRGVIQRALSDASGVYRDAFARLRIPGNRYSATMQFLKRHSCYLEFLPFRRDCE